MEKYNDIFGFSVLPDEMAARLLNIGERLILANPMFKNIASTNLIRFKSVIDDYSEGVDISSGADLAYMTDHEILEKTFVPSMLATPIRYVSSEQANFNNLKSFVYFSSTILVDMKYLGVVGEAAREVRLLATSPRRARFWKDFNCDWIDLGSLEVSLESLKKEKLRGIKTEPIIRLLRLVEESINPKPKNENRNRKKLSVFKRINIIKMSTKYDDENYEIKQVIEFDSKSGREITGGELGDDTKWLTISIREPSVLDGDRNINYLRNREVANQFAMREAAPPARYSGLTASEIKKIISSVVEGIARNELEWVAIALMLFFGRSLQESLEILKQKKRSNYQAVLWRRDSLCALKYVMELPRVKAANYADLEIRDVDNGLLLPVPKVLNPILFDKKLLSLEVSNVTVESVEIKIKALNLDQNIRITKTAISGMAYELMRRKGISESDALWIIGGTPKEFSSLYYYSVKEVDLRAIHRAYLSSIGRIAGIDLSPVSIAEHGTILGSRVHIPIGRVKELVLSILNKKLFLKNRSYESIAEFHNQYIWRCYFIFSLFSGHRAVRNPFQSVCDFNLYTRSLYICDKEIRSSQSARVIPIPDVVIEQFEYLILHYKSLASWLSVTEKELSNGIKKILNGEDGYFLLSLIYFEQLEGLNNKSIEDYFSDYYSLPPNWQRHFLRNYLGDAGCSQDQIDAFMGHANFGREAHGRWSAYGAKEANKIRDCLNALASSLGVFAVKGL